MGTRATHRAVVVLVLFAVSLRPTQVSAAVSLGAWIQHSPDDLSGFSTLTGNDATVTPTMPFSVTIEGVSYSTVAISTNGWLEFGGNTQGTSHPANVCLPTATHTNPFLAAYWDDLNPFGTNVRYGSVGTSPHRTYIVDYEVDLTSGSEGADDLRFQVQIHEGSNLINVRYRDQQSATNGIGATIGFQSAGGASAHPLSCNGKVLDDNRPNEGWSVDAGRAGLVTLAALMAHSPDDISGFTTLSGNDAIAGVTMPFSVTLEGVSYNSVTIGTNGTVQFGTTSGSNPSANTGLPSASFPNPTIFYFWDDLQTEGGNIRYGTVGTSPNRTFIVDFQENLVASSGDKVNGQVQIHEGSGLINVKYRSTLSHPANGQSATIGFQGAGGAAAVAYPLTFNGKILDDNRPDSGWSIHPLSTGAMSLHAFIQHSPDDIGGFATLSGNDSIAGVTMPFSVSIDGVSYNTVTIGTNGLIQFGTTSGANPTGNTALPSASFPNPTLFYFWDDLQTEGGNIRYGTVGASPHRTFIVDFQQNLVASSGNKVNGQVQIHEGSSVFNVQYRSTLSVLANGQSATIGFQAAGGAGATAYPLTFNGKILDDNLPDAGWSVSPLPICGNGITETKEQCDAGGANGTLASCCSATCSFNSNGTPCADDGNQCTNDQCNGASAACLHPNKPNGTACDNGLFCDGTETCTAGTCTNSTGDPCPGPDNDVNCSESCDEGADNCLAADTDGTLCRADAGECDVQETCLGGSCPADAFEPAATACGDPSDTDCTNPDTCDGSGSCQDNHEANGFACGDPSDTDCTNPDTCDGAGSCEDNHELPSVVCRPATTGGDCDEVEFCDGAGSCPADVFTSSGVTCRAPTGDCDVEEECTGSSPFCPADAFEPALTPCGDPTNTDCDNPDTCAGGSDTCLDNLEANGFACGDPSDTDCTNPDTCDGAGTCEDNHEPAATACGDPSDTDCTNPDTCDGAGTCEDNHEAAATACGDPSDTDCTNPDTCDGAGTCEDNHEAAATACGDPSDTVCDNPDTCDGAGTCDDNFEPNTVLCLAATSGGECDEDEYCDGAGSCPPSLPLPSGTVCRVASSGALCDEEETCDGVSFDCPADGVKPNGAICRPDAGDCDVAETCDGASDQCPADGFEANGFPCGSGSDTDCDNPDTCDGSGTCEVNNEADGTPCDDLSACTGGDECTGGVCSGPIDLCPDLDHYKCYQGKDLKNPKFVKLVGVNTTDQLATNELVDVKKLKFVCSPVDKNGEGINAPNSHLACYQLKAPKFGVRPKVEVSTQFQTSQFEIKKGKLLCLPATKSILP